MAAFFVIFGPFSQNERFWPKVMSGGCAANLVPPTSSSSRDCRCISAWEPRPRPEGSQRVSQNPCSEDASKGKPSQSKKKKKKTGVYLEVWHADLLVGFAADFWTWVVDFGGLCADELMTCLFSAGGFSGGFFRRIFFCILRPKQHQLEKSAEKSTTSMAASWRIFHRTLKARPAVSKFQVERRNPPWNWNQVCLPNLFGHV